MRIFFIIPAAVIFLASSADAQLTKIGAAGAVRGQVVALAPVQGAVGRVMESGKEVYLRDAVTTDAKSRMQIMLLDETVFTVGPNSSLVLDEFVYDPNTGAGRMTARVTKGVFRFVTGKIARETPSNMRVKLPVGVIGIRGTIALGKVYSPTSAFVMLAGPGPRNNADEKPGALNVSGAGKEVDIKRTGMGSDLDSVKGPSDPYVVPQAKVNEVTSDLGPSASEPSKDTGGGGSAQSDDTSATDSSGQGTAGALGDLSTTESLSEVTQDNTQLINNASQSSQGGITDGISKWDDLRTVQSGTANFEKSGLSFPCTGCSGGAASGSTVHLHIDFGARAIGGNVGGSPGCSYIYLGNGPNISTTIGLSGSSTNPIPFDSLTGNAILTLGSGNSSNPNYDNSTLTFINSGGVAAKSLEVNVKYSDGTYTVNSATTLSR